MKIVYKLFLINFSDSNIVGNNPANVLPDPVGEVIKISLFWLIACNAFI